MAKGKARTDAQKERDKDKRLQSEYHITLADRDERARQQNNQCKICHGPLEPPCVDHFHFSVKTFRHSDAGMAAIGMKWYAQAYDEFGRVICVMSAKTQTAAAGDVKAKMMPWAIRGLLCRHCNRAMGMLERWFDAARHPDNVLPTLDYLRARLQNT